MNGLTKLRLAAMDSYKKKLAGLSPKKLSELVDKVAHVGDGEMLIRSEYHLSEDEISEFMLDNGYERCPGCKWFVEVGELIGEDSEPKRCSNCE